MQQNSINRVFLITLSLLVACCFPCTSLCEEKTNPFQKLLDDYSYQSAQERLSELLLESEDLARTEMPIAGVRVVQVAPGYQAINLGIKSGSILFELDKKKLWGNLPWGKRSSDSLLILTNPKGTRKAIPVAPGLIGVRYVEHYRPDLFYTRRKTDVNSLWRHHVKIGALHWEADPKLAETAWHNAIEQGYPQDVYSDYFAALFAMHRPEGAGKELDRFMAHFGPDEKIPDLYLPRLPHLLASTGNLKYLKRLSLQEVDNFPWLKTDIAQLESWSGGLPFPEKSLLDRAKALHGELITENLSPFAKRVDVIMPYPLPEFFTQVPSAISQSPGFYTFKRFGQEPALNNLHLSTTITVECNGRDEKWGNMMTFIFEDEFPNFSKKSKPRTPLTTKIKVTKGNKLALVQVKEEPVKTRYPETEPAAKNQLLFIGFYLNVSSATPLLHVAGSQIEALLKQRSPHLSMTGGGSAGDSWDLQTQELIQRRMDEIQKVRTMKIDLVRIGNEAGIYLDGVCYYHLPVDPAANRIAVSYKLSGVEVTVDDFSVWKLPD